jgi:hypothetical protein
LRILGTWEVASNPWSSTSRTLPIIATTRSAYLRGAVAPEAVIDLGDLHEGNQAGAESCGSISFGKALASIELADSLRQYGRLAQAGHGVVRDDCAIRLARTPVEMGPGG